MDIINDAVFLQFSVCFACMTVRTYPADCYCMHKLVSLTVHAKPSHSMLSQNATSDKLVGKLV